MEEQKKLLLNFLRPRFDFALVLGPLLLAVGVLALIMGGGWISLLFFGAGGLLLFADIRERSAFRAWTQTLETSGELPMILSDVRAATPVAGGELLMGERYLYPKGGKKMIAYGDVLQVYQTVHKTNFVENGRSITAVVRNGDKTEPITLCSLALRGKGDDVLRDVMLRLLAKNPNIKLGYK